jgi:hypothetical protein
MIEAAVLRPKAKKVGEVGQFGPFKSVNAFGGVQVALFGKFETLLSGRRETFRIYVLCRHSQE